MVQPKFTITRKGYMPADVDTYVARVLDELSGLRDDLTKAQDQVDLSQADLTATQEELAGTQTELTDVRDDLDATKKTAQDAASLTLEEAEETATATIEEAQGKADDILKAAEAAADETREVMAREEQEMQERLRTRENEITAELDAIDASVSERNQAIAKLEVRLEVEETRYGERIATLRNLAESLEEALKSLMSGSLVELGVYLETHQAAVVDNDIVGEAVHHHFTTDALLAASPPVPGRSPSTPSYYEGGSDDHARPAAEVFDRDRDWERPDVDEPDVDEPDVEEPNVEEVGSFYSRRSAGLPRMGENKGQSILAAMSALRSDADAEDDKDAEGDDA